MIRVARANGQITEVPKEDLLKEIHFNSLEEATYTEDYRGFRLTIVGYRFSREYPGPAAHFNGYIKAIEKPELNDKLESKEIERLAPGGWTGGDDEVGPGFDCAHSGDIGCIFAFVLLKNRVEGWLEKLLAEAEKGEPELEYDFHILTPGRDTYKSREWVLEKLRYIADETLKL